MNQKTVIYIILSAILLYLYYRRGGLDVFAGFMVLVLSAIIFGRDVREGAKNKSGGKKVVDTCAKLGFTAPTIDKGDIAGSLVKALKNIEKVAETYWGFEKGDIEGKRTEDKTLEKSWEAIKRSEFIKTLNTKDKDKDTILAFLLPAYELYDVFIIRKKTSEEKNTFLEDTTMKKLDGLIENSNPVMEILDKFKNSDEMKNADDDVKKLLNYIICLAKQWVSIFKALKNPTKNKAKKEDAEDE